MSLRDKTADQAREWMESTDPECPSCQSKGSWEYGNVELLNKHDLKTDVWYVLPMVRIHCEKCNHEMPQFEGEN